MNDQKRILLAFLLIVLNTGIVHAKTTHILLLGGGGEPKSSPATIFDHALGKIKNTDKIKIRHVAYAGIHSKTDEIISKIAPTKFPFNEDGINHAFSNINYDIQNHLDADKDQVLIIISTHGARPMIGGTSHFVSTIDGAINLTEHIKEIKVQAKNRNIQLAIVDQSCFSGASLDWADENTCVLSETSPHFTGAPLFGHQFFDNIYSAKNLEELFLGIRVNYDIDAYPMMSSADQNATAEHQKLFSTLLVFDRQMYLAGMPAYFQKDLTHFLARGSYIPTYKEFNDYIKKQKKHLSWFERRKLKKMIKKHLNLLHELKERLDEPDYEIRKLRRAITDSGRKIQTLERKLFVAAFKESAKESKPSACANFKLNSEE